MIRFILTYGEIKVIAALAGLKELIMFKDTACDEAETEINAIVRLLNDGLIEIAPEGLRLEATLQPIASVLATADISITEYSPSRNSTPFCFYTNDSKAFLTIAPHEGKEGVYRVLLLNADELVEELENAKVIPPTARREVKSKSILAEETTRLEISEIVDVNELMERVPGEDVLAVFERRNVLPEQRVSKMAVYRAPLAWAMAADGGDIAYYSNEIMVKWIEGEI